MKPKRKAISLLLLLLTALLYLLALLCRFSVLLPPEPETAWMLFGPATPAVLAANLAALLGWLAARRWLAALIPLAAIAAHAGYVASTVRLPHAPAAPHEEEIRIATLNCYGFRYRDEVEITVRNVAETILEERIDILCMQEFGASAACPADSIASRLARSGLRYMVRKNEAAVASRYPILSHRYTRFPESGNDCLQADIAAGDDTLRLFSVHLQTTGLHQLRPADGATDDRSLPVREAIDALTHNGAIRVEQARTVRDAIDASPYPVILAGDFNETPSSYIYRLLRQGLVDGFREAGSGYGGTFRFLGVPLRIDFIFHDPRLRSVDYRTLPYPLSDHRAVVSTLRQGNAAEKPRRSGGA